MIGSRNGTLLAVLTEAVDRELQEVVAGFRSASPLFDLIEYQLGWASRRAGARGSAPGKKTRPLLLLTVNRALGGDLTASLPVAAAIELMHSAALVYDDIQDGSELRRGRPAVWKVCGAAQGINVGVSLQAAVHLAVARAVRSGLAEALALAASEELSLCMVRLAEGQYLDLALQGGSRPSIDEYMRICGAKTASLLGTAAYLGAVLACRDEVAPSARRAGHHLGMYLQIEDDIAGIWGDAGLMGKLPADMEGRKRTLPLLYIAQIEDPPPGLAERMRRYFAGEPMAAEELGELRRIAEELGGRAYAEEMAAFHRTLAQRAMRDLGGEIADELGAVMDSIASSLAAAT